MKSHLMRGARLPAHAFFEGEGEDDYDIDLDKALASPKAKQKIEQWAERTVAAGLKSKNSELLGRLTGYKLSDGEDGQPVYMDANKAREALVYQETEGRNTAEKITSAVQDATHRLEGQLTQANTKVQEAEKGIGTERNLRHSQKIGYELRDTLRESGIKSGKLPLHERYLREFLSVETDDQGNENILIVDEKGAPRYGKDGLMTLKEFVEDYRDKDDIADDWNADTPGGSGQQPGNGVRRSGPQIDPNLSASERLRQHRQNEAASNKTPRRR